MDTMILISLIIGLCLLIETVDYIIETQEVPILTTLITFTLLGISLFYYIDKPQHKTNIIIKWQGKDNTIPPDGSIIRIIETRGDTLIIGNLINN